ncbi:hypothetical protein [Mumia zhuanghuii]|nr:hypothetical protein [Mumia zhuanghuii]
MRLHKRPLLATVSDGCGLPLQKLTLGLSCMQAFRGMKLPYVVLGSGQWL